jgi:Holliday junction DNA helicase RuvA
MIARIEGVLIELEPTRVVIDISGVGYELLIPLSTFTELPDAGKPVALHVHTHVREGTFQLYGFATRAEKKAFELLLRANRVGPRLAQTVLSGISPAQLVEAIRGGDVALLRAVPGVGTKMAQRLMIELRDRVNELSAEVGMDGDTTEIAVREVISPDDDAREQTLSALLNLGYPKAQAERVVAGASEDAGAGASIETLVRAALKRLGR